MDLFVGDIVLSGCDNTSIPKSSDALRNSNTLHKSPKGTDVPAKYGSAPKPSQLRPAAGARPSGPATGASATLTPLTLNSSPSAYPRAYIKRRLEVAPIELSWFLTSTYPLPLLRRRRNTGPSCKHRVR